MASRPGTSFADDQTISKFYAQRYRLWSRFDEGIWMTPGGWSTMSIERFELSMADRCASRLRALLPPKSRLVALDAFCGCGCSAIMLAQHFDSVIAVDFDADCLDSAKKNAAVYGVSDKISFFQRDFFRLLDDDELHGTLKEVNFVHLSPPWGGEEYFLKPFFDIFKDFPGFSITDILRLSAKFSGNIAIYLPRQVLQDQISRAVSQCLPNCEEFEEEFHFINDRMKAVTVYFGSVVDVERNPKIPQSPSISQIRIPTEFFHWRSSSRAKRRRDDNPDG